ncbi:phage protease [Citrobacter freundii]|uniref:phage protease n=1 Tax=Citrobacter freundii TaxID=546 RepID=UPI001BCEF42D|nr:phage protease [Citrobacter freundii]
MSKLLPQIELLALCFELPSADDDAPLPEWLPMIPAGTFAGRDGRSWVNNQPDAVISATLSYPKLPFDMEHATELKGPKGEEAPAYAWLDDYRVRDDGVIEAHVEWTPDGEALVRGKKYRYYSPAFGYTADGQVTRISSAGLTNKPNLDFPALNSENHEMTLPVQIVTVLGLAAAASVDDAVKAIQQIKDRETVALNRAENPDLSKFIPFETHQLALNRAESAEGKLKVLDDKAAVALVDAAIADGKVAPANREMYLATCRSEAGREQFASFVKPAPVLVSADPTKGKDDKGNVTLNEAEIAMCRSMGVTQEEFLAARNKEGVR